MALGGKVKRNNMENEKRNSPPEKSYIPNPLPKGTTAEQWDRYMEEKIAHDDFYARLKPREYEFRTHDEYKSAYSRWLMDESCTEPNKPGYFRANND